jgi:beta-lactam-binding protein with PASTA domain
MTFDQAVEAVRAFETETGVRVNLIQSEVPTTNPAQVGVILATEPPPGTVIQGAVDVIARIGVLGAAPTAPPGSG